MATTLTPDRIEEIALKVADDTRVTLRNMMEGNYLGLCGPSHSKHASVFMRFDQIPEEEIAEPANTALVRIYSDRVSVKHGLTRAEAVRKGEKFERKTGSPLWHAVELKGTDVEPGWEPGTKTPDGGAKGVYRIHTSIGEMKVRIVRNSDIETVSDKTGFETISISLGVDDEEENPDFDTIDPADISVGDHVEWHDDCGVHRWQVMSVSDWTGTKTGVVLQNLGIPFQATHYATLPLVGDPFILRPRS